MYRTIKYRFFFPLSLTTHSWIPTNNSVTRSLREDSDILSKKDELGRKLFLRIKGKRIKYSDEYRYLGFSSSRWTCLPDSSGIRIPFLRKSKKEQDKQECNTQDWKSHKDLPHTDLRPMILGYHWRSTPEYRVGIGYSVS